MPNDDLVSTDDALTLLADETRLAILEALGDAATGPTPSYLAFTDLRERVGVTDSGRFNYHLDKLLGHFVERTDEGYRLRMPGLVVYRDLVAGTFDGDAPKESSTDVSENCLRCGGSLVVTYTAEQIVMVECADCGASVLAEHVPVLGASTRDLGELARIADRRRRHSLQYFVAGDCQWCAGAVQTDLLLDTDELPATVASESAVGRFMCEACQGGRYASPGAIALVSPSVAAFFAAKGRDLRSIPSWSLALTASPDTAVVTNRDPPEVRVSVTLGDETHRVTVDDSLDVTTVDGTPD